jgi:hypothetical protein
MNTDGVACGEVGIKTSDRSRPHPSGSHVSITVHSYTDRYHIRTDQWSFFCSGAGLNMKS